MSVDYFKVYTEIENDFIWLNNNFFHFSLIRDINIKKHEAVLGCKIRIKDEENSYKLVYDSAIKDKTYSILLQDESVISLFYAFDSEKQLIEFSLSFIPNPYIEDDTDIYKRYKNYDFKDIIAQYLRFDMSYEGVIPFLHPITHLHACLNKNAFRLPLKNVIYPKTFLWIIAKYLYNTELYSINKDNQTTFLTKEELSGMLLSFNYDNI